MIVTSICVDGYVTGNPADFAAAAQMNSMGAVSPPADLTAATALPTFNQY